MMERRIMRKKFKVTFSVVGEGFLQVKAANGTDINSQDVVKKERRL